MRIARILLGRTECEIACFEKGIMLSGKWLEWLKREKYTCAHLGMIKDEI